MLCHFPVYKMNLNTRSGMCAHISGLGYLTQVVLLYLHQLFSSSIFINGIVVIDLLVITVPVIGYALLLTTLCHMLTTLCHMLTTPCHMLTTPCHTHTTHTHTHK